MEFYIEAMRSAAEKCPTRELKDIFDYYLSLAIEEYQAGNLDAVEYSYIIDEYNDTLMQKNAAIYIN